MVKTVLADKQMKDGNYICVYLRQSDIPTDSGISPIIYNFNDFIDVAIQKCERYQGIIVIDGNNEVVIPFEHLVEYKRNRLVMRKNFLKIAYGLNENEVSFIGELNYKILKMNLFDDLDDKQIASELGIEENEAKFGFEKGYNRFNLVIISNYL